MNHILLLLALGFTFLGQNSFSAEVIIFGPQKITSTLTKSKSTYTIINNVPNSNRGSLTLQNGSGQNMTLRNCNLVSGLQKIICNIENAAKNLAALVDKPASFSVKWNNIEIANSTTVPLTTGKVVIPLNILSSNQLVVERQGLPSSSLTVTIQRETVAVNQLPLSLFSITPTSGIAPELITMSALLSNDPDGQIVSYQWNFGDGSVGTGLFTSHQYLLPGNYTISLKVTDNNSGQNTSTQNIAIRANSLPIPLFTFALNQGAPDFTMQFNASTSSDSDGSIVSYAWTFGDQTSGTGISPTHQYQSSGNYNVVLTVTDDKGGVSVRNQTISILNKDPLALWNYEECAVGQ